MKGEYDMVQYEKAERAKMLLIELQEQVSCDSKSVKEFEQLETIIRKLEVWQMKYDR